MWFPVTPGWGLPAVVVCGSPLGLQVRIRTNSVEFESPPNSHEFVDPLEFEFEPKFLEILCNHLEVHPFHPVRPVGGGIILRGGHKGRKKF